MKKISENKNLANEKEFLLKIKEIVKDFPEILALYGKLLINLRTEYLQEKI